jgi:hypothetical protein
LTSSNQVRSRAMAQERKPVSVVQYLRSQGHTISEAPGSIFTEIDQKVPEELRYFLTRRDGAAILCESLRLARGMIPGEIADVGHKRVTKAVIRGLDGIYGWKVG